MERCSISPATRLPYLWCLLLVAVVTRPTSCDTEDRKWEELGEMQVEALSAQLSVTAQATPTPLWAVDWGPTQPLEDETHHFLSSLETDSRQATTAESWPHHQSAPTTPAQQQPASHEARVVLEEKDGKTEAEERETEEVDPQFYVTVTISSLLILTAVIITAKLCYDRSCSQHPPPLSRGVPPPLSLAIPRSLAQEDSRQTLHSTPSFTDRERIPVVNL